MKAQMKHKTAKLFAVLLAVSLLFVGGQPAFAQEEPAGVLSYALNGSEATITDCSEDATDENVADAFTQIANLHYTVTSIGGLAFRDCVNLTVINLPSSVTNISIGAFLDCTGLTNVTLPSDLTAIGMSAFSGCASLADITLPSGLTNISRGTFYGCASLTDITLPDDLTDIGEGAFSGSGLTDIDIPAGVTFIGQNAFLYMTNLSTITVDPDNGNYTSDDDGVLFNKEKTVLIQYPIGNARSEYTIPDTVIDIGLGAFSGCVGLTGITLPVALTSIGDAAFSDCANLGGIVIPAGVTSIGDSAFSGTGLTAITVDGENLNYASDADGVLFNKDKTMLVQYPGGHTRSDYTIPDGVEDIGWGAFDGCKNLTGVILPDSVTGIYPWAFSNTGLTEITIPSNATFIGYNAFAFCESLSEITLADGKTDLPLDFLTDDSFQDDLRLYVPVSVTSVGGSSSLDPPADVTLSGKPIIYAAEGSFIATWAAANLPPDRLRIIGSDVPSNASLSALSLSNGTLSPAFNAATKSYTASVANGVSSITVTATAANPLATVTGSGIGLPASLNIGANTLNITVTAEDGVTAATYSVVVTRASYNNDNGNGNGGGFTPPPAVTTPPETDDSETPPTTGDGAANTAPGGSAFADIPAGSWFRDAVSFVSELGIMGGSGSEQTFKPEQTMTRAMLITALARYDGVDTSIGETWYSAAVAWGIANDVTDGSGLNDDVTREQIVTMLWRYAGQPQIDASFDGIPDAADISPYAADAFKWAIDAGIITGYDDKTVKPQKNATRAEVAAILMRYIQAVE